MTQPSTPIQIILFSTLLVFASPAAAIEEVYKWVDTKGATHYGQAPPVTQPASIEKITLAEHNPETIVQPNIQATLDVAKQLEISRLARERFRLEKKKAHTEKLKALQAQQATYNQSRWGYGYSSYNRPYYGRPHKPYHPARPHKSKLSHHQTASSHRPATHTGGSNSAGHGGGSGHTSSPH